jgi:hypothetical protein
VRASWPSYLGALPVAVHYGKAITVFIFWANPIPPPNKGTWDGVIKTPKPIAYGVRPGNVVHTAAALPVGVKALPRSWHAMPSA